MLSSSALLAVFLVFTCFFSFTFISFLAALGSFFPSIHLVGVSGDRGPRLVSSNDKEESRQQVGEYDDPKDERKTRRALGCSDRV